MLGDKEAANDAAATARPAAEVMPTRHVLALTSASAAAARGLLRPGRVPAAIIGDCIYRQFDTIMLLPAALLANGHKRRWHFMVVAGAAGNSQNLGC